MLPDPLRKLVPMALVTIPFFENSRPAPMPVPPILFLTVWFQNSQCRLMFGKIFSFMIFIKKHLIRITEIFLNNKFCTYIGTWHWFDCRNVLMPRKCIQLVLQWQYRKFGFGNYAYFGTFLACVASVLQNFGCAGNRGEQNMEWGSFAPIPHLATCAHTYLHSAHLDHQCTVYTVALLK